MDLSPVQRKLWARLRCVLQLRAMQEKGEAPQDAALLPLVSCLAPWLQGMAPCSMCFEPAGALPGASALPARVLAIRLARTHNTAQPFPLTMPPSASSARQLRTQQLTNQERGSSLVSGPLIGVCQRRCPAPSPAHQC